MASTGRFACTEGAFELRYIALHTSANAKSLKVFFSAPKLVHARAFARFQQPDYVALVDGVDSADTIALSFGARLLDDPNLQWLYVTLVIFVGISKLTLTFLREEAE